MNKTKIIATIGPSSESEAALKQIIKSGVDVIRLNMKYADHDYAKKIIEMIRNIDSKLKTNTGIMFDTLGQDIRIGKIYSGEATLDTGDKIRVYKNDLIGDKTKFSINEKEIFKYITPNMQIKLNDGKISLQVLENNNNYILCLVTKGGVITSGNGFNVPCRVLGKKYLNKTDIKDIKFAISMKIDYLALSFIYSSEDVLEVEDLLIKEGNDSIKIISKLETESSVDDLEHIIRLSDGIMIARGDLGVEMPMEAIPSIQKKAIKRARELGKISIVATEMLSTMERMSNPTRAEVSDVANAVIDGVDAVMLSGETSIGSYPIEAVEMMSRIIDASEENIDYIELLEKASKLDLDEEDELITFSAASCANRINASLIVVPTYSGKTAEMISKYRPKAQILALSPNEKVVTGLSMYFGIKALKIEEITDFDKLIKLIKTKIKKELDIENTTIIITGGYPNSKHNKTNYLQIEKI